MNYLQNKTLSPRSALATVLLAAALLGIVAFMLANKVAHVFAAGVTESKDIRLARVTDCSVAVATEDHSVHFVGCNSIL